MKRGFTLIELLVVIAIIGVLSSVVLASLNNARLNARSAQRISAMREVQKALEVYYLHNGAYPTTGSYARFDCYVDNTYYTNYIPGLVPTYMSALPHDPATKCQGNKDYNFGYQSNGTDYKLFGPMMPNNGGKLENCSYGISHGVEDPARPCATSGDPSWALYTPGASLW
jgi:type II secretion system protein G